MYTKTLLARYALYVFIVLEVLFLPKLISSETYTSYEYIKSIVFMFPAVLLGSYSGFIYSKYTENSNEFSTLITFGLISSLISGTLAALYLGRLIYLIPFVVINIFTLVEQQLKVEKEFILAFSFKPLLSIVVLLLGLLSYSNIYVLSFDLLLGTSFLITIIIWLGVGGRVTRVFAITRLNKNSIKRYLHLIKKGFPIAMTSICLMLLFFTDRYFIANYYNEYLPTYSFGFNLSQMLVMALSTIAYVAVIDLGERKDHLSKALLSRNFRKGILLYLALLIMMIPGLALLNQFYNYNHLISITLLISYSKGFYFLLTTISAVILYFDYQWKALIMIVSITVLNYLLLSLAASLETSVYIILLLSSISLLIYSLYNIYLIFYRIDYSTKKDHSQ